MDTPGTKERLQEVFRRVFDDGEIVIEEDTTADDIEDWDSLTHVQLILAVEEEFHAKFSTAEIMRLKNVGEFIRLIEKKKSNG